MKLFFKNKESVNQLQYCFFNRTASFTGVLQHGWLTTSITPSTHRHVCNTSLNSALCHLDDYCTLNQCAELLTLMSICLHADYGEKQVKAALGIFLVSTFHCTASSCNVSCIYLISVLQLLICDFCSFVNLAASRFTWLCEVSNYLVRATQNKSQCNLYGFMNVMH